MEQLLDISDPRDLQAWARTFHVTPDRLAEVVRQSGASPERIRDALKRAELARVGGRHFGDGSRSAPDPRSMKRRMGSNSLGLAPHVVARLRNFMADNLRRPLRVKEMAAIACLSEFHFSRQFRIATGESPHRFFNRLRMEQARRLLQHSDLRLAEIAGAVGYRTQASFAMAFRDAYGQPPGRYGRGFRGAFPTAADHPYNLSR